MNDYEYEFMRDSMDKKNIARSARSTRTHCGKRGAVRFPSDNLSKKEIKAMSGEVKSYRMNDPMTWDEFKAMPNDLKVTYITAIRERFGAPDKYIAEMFGTSAKTLTMHLIDLKCNSGKGSGNARRPWEKEKFYAWTHGVDEDAVEGTAEVEPEAETEVESKVEPPMVFDCVAPIETKYETRQPLETNRVIPKSGSMRFDGTNVDELLSTIRTLLGGATVDCTFVWEVVDK